MPLGEMSTTKVSRILAHAGIPHAPLALVKLVARQVDGEGLHQPKIWVLNHPPEHIALAVSEGRAEGDLIDEILTGMEARGLEEPTEEMGRVLTSEWARILTAGLKGRK